MIVGFTGTRLGTTYEQAVWLQERLMTLGTTELHHGDCVGADDMVHDLARWLGVRIVIHPPDDDHYRAFCEAIEGDEVLDPKPYLDRNHDIVDVCDVLLALPDGPERLRSGTWSTVRYARRIGKRVEVREP
jgi:hypothetical protein